jgi:delta-aminolevulinic acid dehydratase/porphobilinogen synthase
MLKAAAHNGRLGECACMLEARGFKRAGADGVLAYFARDATRWLSKKQMVKTFQFIEAIKSRSGLS